MTPNLTVADLEPWEWQALIHTVTTFTTLVLVAIEKNSEYE